MEQRIGSSSQPLEGAGSDPAFIPGLTSPVSGREEDAKAKTDDPEADTAPEADAADTEAAGAAGMTESAGDATDPEAKEGAEADEEAPGPAPEGPVFEASDRRARVVADHSGVRLRLDDQECEFRWDEIGAVETETGRFGKRYTVTVHTPDRRWYPIEIEADARSRFAEWDTELDAVLDAYFDEGADEPMEPKESTASAEVDTDIDTETDPEDGDEKSAS